MWRLTLQHIVGNPETAGGKQLVTVAIVLKRTGLADQACDDMPVVDPMLTLAPEPRNVIDLLLPVPHFQVLGMESYVYPFTPETAVEGVGVLVDPDRAAGPDFHSQFLVSHKALSRQVLEHGEFFLKTLPATDIALGEEFAAH